MPETFGRYRLLESLGRGGMAEVFRAKSMGVEGFEKVVVIKRILPELAKDPLFVERFIHEAKLAVRLSHANIVQVFDLGLAPLAMEGLEGGTGEVSAPAYFIAMEYVHGFDLATVLSALRRQAFQMPLELAVYIAAEVAKGLDHAHRRRDESMQSLGIVHRDVSPQNVLVSLEGEVKVADFGIAKALHAMEIGALTDDSVRMLHGKYGYMSPEQARGEEVDARSDLYSLGIVLYECLAGVNPFSAPSTFEMLRRAQAGEYPPLELLRPDVPSSLLGILRTAMARDASARFADAGRMYEDLLSFLYASGARAGARELAQLLRTHCGPLDPAAGLQSVASDLRARFIDPETTYSGERTPVDGRRVGSLVRRESSPALVVASPAEGGERAELRDVTALVVRSQAVDVLARVRALCMRHGARVPPSERGELVALFGAEKPEGREIEVAARVALALGRAVPSSARWAAGLHVARVRIEEGERLAEDERFAELVGSARELCRARERACIVSPAAARLLRPRFELEAVTGTVRAGLSGGECLKSVRSSADSSARFVGRKHALRVFGDALAAATKQKPCVITVRGENGTGKSRLLLEVERRLHRGGYSVGFFCVASPAGGRSLARSGIVGMMQTIVGVSDADWGARVAATASKLQALGVPDDEARVVLSAMGDTSGAGAASVGLDPHVALRRAFLRVVGTLSEDRPHVFAWDDAHAVDDDSFAILGEVLRRVSSGRFVFVFAGRAGFAHPLEGSSGHTAIELTDLLPEEVARLVCLRLGVGEAPDELVRFLMDRAGGHPLFLEELLAALVEAKAVTVADQRVRQMRLVGQALALPRTLRALVSARVSRLGAEERALLSAACVLEDPISLGTLAQMLRASTARVDEIASRLRRAGMLAERGPLSVAFTSPILREVVLDTLTVEGARAVHAAAAIALSEGAADGTTAEETARIATHFYESGDRDVAAARFAEAGHLALRTRDHDMATQSFARALELCDPSTVDAVTLTEWLAGYAKAVRWVRTSPEALETCDRVLARIDQAGSTELRIAARLDAARVLGACSLFDAAELRAAEALQLSTDEGARAVRLVQSELAAREGNFARAAEVLESLGHGVALADRHEEHKRRCALAQARASQGDNAAARVALAQAEELLPGDAHAACERAKVAVLVEYFSGDFSNAATEATRAVELARKQGLTYEMMVNLHNLGDALIRRSELARAYAALRQSLDLCEEAGYERHAQLNRTYLAFLDAVAGDPEAEKQLRAGIRYAESRGFAWDSLGARALLADFLRRKGRLDQARAEYTVVLQEATRTGNRVLRAEAERFLQEVS